MDADSFLATARNGCAALRRRCLDVRGVANMLRWCLNRRIGQGGTIMGEAVPRGSTAVMARRVEPPDSLDLFATPPWATRALIEYVIDNESVPLLSDATVWEPAAGLGHMSEVLKEYFGRVLASDVFDYGCGHLVGSFVGDGQDVLPDQSANWIITNPPFRLSADFAERATGNGQAGVALLVRSVWAEGKDRYERLFNQNPPYVIAQFVERVPMVKGRWDPAATTATSYAWFVWRPSFFHPLVTRFMWIPPCRELLTKPDDISRFAGRVA